MPFFRTPSNDRLWLPQAGIKSFNDLCIKSNSFCHLREMLYESPFPKVSRYGIMAITSSLLWNHAPSYSSVELLPTNLNPCHLLPPISLDVCFVSQPKRCFNVSLHELILSCSIFEKIVFCRVSFPLHRVGWRSRRQRRQEQCDAIYRYLREGQLDREDCDSFVTPLSSYLTSWISGRDSCFSGGELSHPKFW